MVECQLKGLCYNCDEIYFPGHKCKEQKKFMVISEDVYDEDVEVSPEVVLPPTDDIKPPFDPPEVEPLISLHTLIGFSSPQTLKLIGYIKHRKVIILIDSGRTHNFIHLLLAQEVNCYIRVVNNFQIMIANGSFMKCGGRCENVCLQIGQHNLKSHIFSIGMGGCDIVLGVKWLCTLVTILMDFKELTLQFQQEGQQYKFQGITTISTEIISSHHMEKLLKKFHFGIIAQLHSIQEVEAPSIYLDLQAIILFHHTIFQTY
jgi:hypothetical protein